MSLFAWHFDPNGLAAPFKQIKDRKDGPPSLVAITSLVCGAAG
jgi:hypothetical protein